MNLDTIDTMAITRDAYQAYGDSRDWKAYDGKPMPAFDALPDGIRDAWRASVLKTIESYERATTAPFDLVPPSPP